MKPLVEQWGGGGQGGWEGSVEFPASFLNKGLGLSRMLPSPFLSVTF